MTTTWYHLIVKTRAYRTTLAGPFSLSLKFTFIGWAGENFFWYLMSKIDKLYPILNVFSLTAFRKFVMKFVFDIYGRRTSSFVIFSNEGTSLANPWKSLPSS